MWCFPMSLTSNFFKMKDVTVNFTICIDGKQSHLNVWISCIYDQFFELVGAHIDYNSQHVVTQGG